MTASGGSFYGTGTVQAITGQVVTNVVLASATASISDSDVTAGGDVTVSAANHSGIDATLLVAATSGDLALNISLAFNSLGWKSQNILFNLADAILGSPMIAGALDGEDPSLVSATITSSTIDAGGDVTVSADGAALLNATVSNAADSAASALFNATGKAIGIAVAQNKVSTKSLATITGGSATAGGDLAVTARDEAGIFSNVKIVSSSQTTNDGGTKVLQDEINNFLDGVDFISSDAAANIKLGDKVRITADQATGTGADDVKKGSVYVWMGEDGVRPHRPRTTPTCGSGSRYRRPHLVPQGLNFTNSDSMAIGGAIVVERRVGARSRRRSRLDRDGRQRLRRRRREAATIQASTDVTASSSGGSIAHRPGPVARRLRRDRDEPGAQQRRRAIDRRERDDDGRRRHRRRREHVADRRDDAGRDDLGHESVGVELAFNTIGWKRSNLLFARSTRCSATR